MEIKKAKDLIMEEMIKDLVNQEAELNTEANIFLKDNNNMEWVLHK